MQVEENSSSSTFPFFQIFAGNSDSTSVIRQRLLYPIQTRFLRLTILTAHRLSNNNACLRMEIYGCSKGKSYIYFIVLLGMSLHCLTLRTTKDCQKLDD